jgi:hypothetical protein
MGETGVADTMIEADPVQPSRSTSCIPVAQMKAPHRRMFATNELARGPHGLEFEAFTALLPSAIDPDIQDNRVVDRRHRTRIRRCNKEGQKDHWSLRRHLFETDIS